MNPTAGPDLTVSTSRRSKVSEWCDCATDCARDQPLKCLGWAFGIGIVSALLPLGRIVGLIFAVAFFLLRPALIVLGVMKAFEEIDRRR